MISIKPSPAVTLRTSSTATENGEASIAKSNTTTSTGSPLPIRAGVERHSAELVPRLVPAREEVDDAGVRLQERDRARVRLRRVADRPHPGVPVAEVGGVAGVGRVREVAVAGEESTVREDLRVEVAGRERGEHALRDIRTPRDVAQPHGGSIDAGGVDAAEARASGDALPLEGDRVPRPAVRVAVELVGRGRSVREGELNRVRAVRPHRVEAQREPGRVVAVRREHHERPIGRELLRGVDCPVVGAAAVGVRVGQQPRARPVEVHRGDRAVAQVGLREQPVLSAREVLVGEVRLVEHGRSARRARRGDHDVVLLHARRGELGARRAQVVVAEHRVDARRDRGVRLRRPGVGAVGYAIAVAVGPQRICAELHHLLRVPHPVAVAVGRVGARLGLHRVGEAVPVGVRPGGRRRRAVRRTAAVVGAAGQRHERDGQRWKLGSPLGSACASCHPNASHSS